MKKIKLRTDLYNGPEKLSTAAILRLVVGNSPQRPMSIDEIRRRVRVLDVLDEATKPGAQSEFLLLEDEDHKTLVSAIEGFPWSAASKALLTIIDDIVQADKTKAPTMRVVEGERPPTGVEAAS